MINTQGLSIIIKGLSNKKYKKLNKYLVIKYEELHNRYITNSALFEIYITIKDYLYSFVSKNKIPNTIEFPSYACILSTGVQLKTFLILAIKRAPLYVGTDKKNAVDPFKNKIQNIINIINNNSLYTISINKLTIHKTTKSEFKEFLKNLNIKYA